MPESMDVLRTKVMLLGWRVVRSDVYPEYWYLAEEGREKLDLNKIDFWMGGGKGFMSERGGLEAVLAYFEAHTNG